MRHSQWTGSNPDFNKFLSIYNKEIDSLIKDGFFYNNEKYEVKVLLFVADAPARSKACNSRQHNGKYGCLNCLHPTVYEKNKTIYPYDTKPSSLKPLYGLRTCSIYNEQVKISERRKNENERIDNGKFFRTIYFLIFI